MRKILKAEIGFRKTPRRDRGNLSMLSFWEPVRPAVNPALAPVVAPGAATNGASGPLAEALALLVTRVGGEAPQLSLESLYLGEVPWAGALRVWVKSQKKGIKRGDGELPNKVVYLFCFGMRPTGPQPIIREPL